MESHHLLSDFSPKYWHSLTAEALVRHREVQVSVGIGVCVFVLRNQFKASEMAALKVLFEGSFGRLEHPSTAGVGPETRKQCPLPSESCCSNLAGIDFSPPPPLREAALHSGWAFSLTGCPQCPFLMRVCLGRFRCTSFPGKRLSLLLLRVLPNHFLLSEAATLRHVLRETFGLMSCFWWKSSQGTGDHGKGWRKREGVHQLRSEGPGVVVLEFSSVHSAAVSQEGNTILGSQAQGKLSCL